MNKQLSIPTTLDTLLAIPVIATAVLPYLNLEETTKLASTSSGIHGSIDAHIQSDVLHQVFDVAAAKFPDITEIPGLAHAIKNVIFTTFAFDRRLSWDENPAQLRITQAADGSFIFTSHHETGNKVCALKHALPHQYQLFQGVTLDEFGTITQAKKMIITDPKTQKTRTYSEITREQTIYLEENHEETIETFHAKGVYIPDMGGAKRTVSWADGKEQIYEGVTLDPNDSLQNNSFCAKRTMTAPNEQTHIHEGVTLQSNGHLTHPTYCRKFTIIEQNKTVVFHEVTLEEDGSFVNNSHCKKRTISSPNGYTVSLEEVTLTSGGELKNNTPCAKKTIRFTDGRIEIYEGVTLNSNGGFANNSGCEKRRSISNIQTQTFEGITLQPNGEFAPHSTCRRITIEQDGNSLVFENVTLDPNGNFVDGSSCSLKHQKWADGTESRHEHVRLDPDGEIVEDLAHHEELGPNRNRNPWCTVL